MQALSAAYDTPKSPWWWFITQGLDGGMSSWRVLARGESLFFCEHLSETPPALARCANAGDSVCVPRRFRGGVNPTCEAGVITPCTCTCTCAYPETQPAHTRAHGAYSNCTLSYTMA
eukprot:scaffold57442_cov70-Phaeocystis_antarctica.AAC.9